MGIQLKAKYLYDSWNYYQNLLIMSRHAFYNL